METQQQLHNSLDSHQEVLHRLEEEKSEMETECKVNVQVRELN